MRRAALAGLVLMVALAGVVLAQGPRATQPVQPVAVSPTLSDLHPGEGWQELHVETEGGLKARAWNDPAAGCNLASFAMPIPATAQLDPLAKSFAKILGSKALSATELAREGESLRWQLDGEKVRGIANMRLDRQSPTVGDSSASLLACYWNEREPEWCAKLCLHILDKPTTESP